MPDDLINGLRVRACAAPTLRRTQRVRVRCARCNACVCVAPGAMRAARGTGRVQGTSNRAPSRSDTRTVLAVRCGVGLLSAQERQSSMARRGRRQSSAARRGRRPRIGHRSLRRAPDHRSGRSRKRSTAPQTRTHFGRLHLTASAPAVKHAYHTNTYSSFCLRDSAYSEILAEGGRPAREPDWASSARELAPPSLFVWLLVRTHVPQRRHHACAPPTYRLKCRSLNHKRAIARPVVSTGTLTGACARDGPFHRRQKTSQKTSQKTTAAILSRHRCLEPTAWTACRPLTELQGTLPSLPAVRWRSNAPAPFQMHV